MNKLLIIAIAVLLAIFISFSTVFSIFNNPPKGIPQEGARYILDHGSTTRSIATDLKKSGYIRSDFFFRVMSRLGGMDGKMQAGPYLIGRHDSTTDILKMFVSGKIELARVTIPEGFTINKIAEIFMHRNIVDAEEFLAAARNKDLLMSLGIQAESAEGFLFPDTYRMPYNYPAELVLKTLVQSFFKKLASIYPNYQEMPWDDFYRRIIMASIVEKEYRVEKEAPMIASVFYNRLDQNIALESCASVVYVITELQGKPHPSRLFYKDLEVESPYNAYKNKGLPPGPISNPGPAALDAAFNPAKTDYLFFVVENAEEGTHLFSNNLADHEAGRERYVETYFPK